MQDGGQSEQRQRPGEHPQGVQPLAGQSHPAGELEQRPAAQDPHGGPDQHLQHERAGHVDQRATVDGPGGEQAGHQRDADRVVGTRLALQHRPAAAPDLAPAEDGEHHRRVGRGQGRADQQRQVAADAEHQVRHQGQRGGGEERAEHPDQGDGGGGCAEPAPADRGAAVQQDDQQGDGHDPLDGPLRGRQPRDDPDSRYRRQEEQGGCGDAHPGDHPAGQHRHQHREAGDQHNQAEGLDVIHGTSGGHGSDIADQASRRAGGEGSAHPGPRGCPAPLPDPAARPGRRPSRPGAPRTPQRTLAPAGPATPPLPGRRRPVRRRRPGYASRALAMTTRWIWLVPS